jgi:glycosyltransferase involved in cell wall biosynthesis
MTQLLTVLIPCKNELANIAPCIESVRGLADEILVADSGSTDGTLEYVLLRGDCRVIERDYRTAGDFKNWAIPQARHAWVLIVEADERVTPELAMEIREALSAKPAAQGFWISRLNHLLGRPIRHTDWGRDRVLRLFRRDLCKYIGPGDHQIAQVAGEDKSFDAPLLRAPLLHFTMWSWTQYLTKLNRYARVQAEQWHAAGKRPSAWKMLTRPPMRFLRDFVLHRGFLEGAAGLQLSWASAFYTFMKQAHLWELCHGRSQQDVESRALASIAAGDQWIAADGRFRAKSSPNSEQPARGARRAVAV